MLGRRRTPQGSAGNRLGRLAGGFEELGRSDVLALPSRLRRRTQAGLLVLHQLGKFLATHGLEQPEPDNDDLDDWHQRCNKKLRRRSRLCFGTSPCTLRN